MTNAIAYMRCSGRAQIEGDTWERQSAAIRRYAAANDIQIVGEFRDEGVSGKTEMENRPGLARCLEQVEAGAAGLVIVEASDRLARDAMIAEVIIREFQKLGARIVAASGGVDLTEGDDANPTAKLVRQILAAVAEFDRCVTVLKLRAARERKKSKIGRCEGRLPYGVTPEERATIARIRALRASGMLYSQIASRLNSEGIPARSGGVWHGGTISKIAARTSGDTKMRESCAA